MENNKNKETYFYQSDEDTDSDENKLVIDETTTDSPEKENVDSDFQSEKESPLAQNLPKANDNRTAGNSYVKNIKFPMEAHDNFGDHCSNFNTKYSRSLPKQESKFSQALVFQKHITFQDSSDDRKNTAIDVIKNFRDRTLLDDGIKVGFHQLTELRCKNLALNQHNVNTENLKNNDLKKNLQIKLEDSNTVIETTRLSKVEERLDSLTVNRDNCNPQSIKVHEPALGNSNPVTKIPRPAKSKKPKGIAARTTNHSFEQIAIPSSELYPSGEKSSEIQRKETNVRRIRVHTDEIPSTSGVSSIIPRVHAQKSVPHILNAKQKQDVIKNETLSFVCIICERPCTSKSRLQHHNRHSHGRVLKEVVKKENSRLFDCIICNRQYKSENGFNNHINVVHGNGDFKCVVCTAQFATAEHLIEHQIRRRHSTFQCCVCSAVFADMGLLTEHKIKNCNLSKCDTNCSICGTNLRLNSILFNENR